MSRVSRLLMKNILWLVKTRLIWWVLLSLRWSKEHTLLEFCHILRVNCRQVHKERICHHYPLWNRLLSKDPVSSGKESRPDGESQGPMVLHEDSKERSNLLQIDTTGGPSLPIQPPQFVCWSEIAREIPCKGSLLQNGASGVCSQFSIGWFCDFHNRSGDSLFSLFAVTVPTIYSTPLMIDPIHLTNPRHWVSLY